MSKSYFFLGHVCSEEKDRRVTSGDDFRVDGGDKETHQKAVEICHELSKEFRKDPPQTPGEERMIVLEVAKKIR